MNIFSLFRQRIIGKEDRVFIETPDGEKFTYDDALQESGRIAQLLHDEGVSPGDRVAVQVEKSPHALFLYLACLRSGAIYLPLNTAYQPSELEYFIGDAEPAVVVCAPESFETISTITTKGGIRKIFTLGNAGEGTLLAQAPKVGSEHADAKCGTGDIAAILYSSGTTGRPKGAMLTHKNLAANAEALADIWKFTEDDVLLHALPIFHAHGLFVACNLTLLNGARMIFLPKFDAEQIVDLLPQASVFMGVPTFYTRLLADPSFTKDVTRNIRLFISGSAPLLPEVFEAFRTRTGQAILERYGMTETGMLVSNPLEGERRAGTVGFPLPGVDLRVAGDNDVALEANQIGEIQVKGPNVFKGYWRMPEKTAAEFTSDGLFRTGDLGKLDERGYVHIVGRSKDLIISGGYNVYPKEIELLINTMSGVEESAVVGMPHPDFGEAGLAIIVPRKGTTGPDTANILKTLRTELANYKVPKQAVIVESLPRNAMGKVQKNVLQSQFLPAWTEALR